MRLLTILAVILVTAPAWADDRITQSNDQNLQTTGDVTTGSDNKTFAFSHSLGDVDINEGQNCLGSEAWGSFIVSRQTNELNPWCAALFYELNGKHEFAAKMRCDIKEIRKKYETDVDCWSDQDMTPAQPDTISEVVDDVVEAVVTEHYQDIETVQMEQSALEDRIQALESKPAPKAPPPQIIQQAAAKPLYSDDHFDAVWSALKGDDDE